MKRFLIWVAAVIAGVILLLGAVIGYSWFSVNESSMPDAAAAQFGGVSLEQNGYSWHVPLLGAAADKVFTSSPSLTAQQLGTFTDAHPELTLPAWASQAELTVTNRDTGKTVFSGSSAEYAAFAYETAGNYELTAKIWYLPEGMSTSDFEQTEAQICDDPKLEHPAKATGWYSYRARFTLSPVPQVTLSADTIRQGGTAAVIVTGLLGSETPAAETDLGTIFFEKRDYGWLGFAGAAYNADAGVHTITVTAGEQSISAELTVIEHRYGTKEVEPDEAATDEANTEFRSKIWPLYTMASGEQQWYGKWSKPVAYSAILRDYGVIKVVNGKQGGKSNSVLLQTAAGDEVTAPAGGTVLFSGSLLLTGNTVVIDHGCGVRTYLYGLDTLLVKKGDTVLQGGAVGLCGDTLTLDVKIGSKSINPWDLFSGTGGLFYVG